MDVADAADAAQALSRVQRGQFHVALIDHDVQHMRTGDGHMPASVGFDGVALARELSRVAGELLMVLLHSTGAMLTPADQTLFAARLEKPAQPDQLMDRLCALRLIDQPQPQPQPQPCGAGSTPSRESLPPGGQPLRVLLAEDNLISQRVALLFLRKLGHTPDVVADGQAAVRAVERQHYDVILMDLQMPILDGIQATDTIRRMSSAGHRPYIVAMTAHTQDSDRDHCMAAGMDDYIHKPIELGSLSEVLRRAVPRE